MVFLALGANLGPAEARLRGALRALAAPLHPLTVAGLYRTRPVSSQPQPWYLNTVAKGWTTLVPEALLALIKQLERAAGRQQGERWAPRPLDIDLLLHGDWRLDRPELTLPHPRMRERRFVLAPLAELAPDLALPPDGATVASLLARVGQEDDVLAVPWSELPLDMSCEPPLDGL